jgi:hypothetical protein
LTGSLIFVAVGLAVAIGLIALTAHRPVPAVVALFLYTAVQQLLVDLAGSTSSLGSAIKQSVDALILLVLIGLYLRGERIRGPGLHKLGLLVGGYLFLGVASGIYFHAPISVMLIAGWLSIKLFAFAAIGLLTPWPSGIGPRLVNMVLAAGVVAAIGGFIDYADPVGFKGATGLLANVQNQLVDFRVDAVTSFFPNPGRFSFFMGVCFAVAAVRAAIDRPRRASSVALAVLFLVSELLSLRLKGLIEIAAVPLLVLAVWPQRGKVFERLAAASIALLVGGSLLVSNWSLVTTQFGKATASGSEASPRTVLYATGISVANSNFPLGAGFGRYGSSQSTVHFSPIYDQYAISDNYGMSRDHPQFLTDTSWPAVYGEAGWLGLALYVLSCVLIWRSLRRSARSSDDPHESSASPGYGYVMASVVFGVILVDSLANPTLFDSMAGAMLAVTIGVGRGGYFVARAEESAQPATPTLRTQVSLRLWPKAAALTRARPAEVSRAS